MAQRQHLYSAVVYTQQIRPDHFIQHPSLISFQQQQLNKYSLPYCLYSLIFVFFGLLYTPRCSGQSCIYLHCQLINSIGQFVYSLGRIVHWLGCACMYVKAKGLFFIENTPIRILVLDRSRFWWIGFLPIHQSESVFRSIHR